MHHRRNFVLAHMCGAGALGNALSSQGEVLAANRVDEQELDFFGAGKLVGGFWRIGEHGGWQDESGWDRIARSEEAREDVEKIAWPMPAMPSLRGIFEVGGVCLMPRRRDGGF